MSEKASQAETLEQSAADFIEQLAINVHGPRPSDRQIAEITRIVVTETDLVRQLA